MTKKMMSEELVEWLGDKIDTSTWYKDDEQAYQEIKKRLEQKPKHCEWWTEEAGCVTSEDCPYLKPISREFVEEIAVNIASDYSDVAFPNLITIVKYVIKKAGHEVEEEK